MDDLQAWVPQSIGEAGDGNPQPPSAQQSNPEPSEISAESWRQAEQATQEVIKCIQPTVISEQRRRAVVEYVQKLIRGNLPIEIFPFGSVPLKTYLPDGDIDLIAFGMPNSEDVLANEVHYVLELEEQNKDAEFEVKNAEFEVNDVQYIHAEVKLVKCIVQNIVVDISFNQIGGLCTLCFLEQVDKQIGRDHLFKRSVILIKSWCYYESRILGAHHGLISTYGLETLVLYIFRRFHKSLDGPLAVLYRFLDYYGKFDWDNYSISVHGPIPIFSLPELVAEPPETHESDLLLSKEFLKKCVERFSVPPPRGLEDNPRIFSQKHLNIVDPLKENNNLGRSVSKGNSYRIRSAFTYGARKLGRILLLPAENMADEVTMFFTNTLERHGSGERPDVQFPSHSDSTMIDHDVLGSLSSDLKVEKCNKDKLISGSATTNSYEALSEKINNIKISVSEKENGTRTQLSRHPFNQHLDTDWLEKCPKTEPNSTMEGNVVSGKLLAGDARDLATRRTSDLRAVSENYEDSPSSSETGSSPSGKAYHAPHLFFRPANGAQGEVIDQANSTNLGVMNKVCTTRAPAPDEEFIRSDFYETESSRSGRSNVISLSAGSVDGPVKSRWNSYSSEDSHLADHLMARNQRIGNNRSPKLNDLSDLTGDYDMHNRNLLFVQECQEFYMGPSLIPLQQLSPSHFRNKNSWNTFHRWNMYTHMGANGAIPGPPFSPPGYLVNSPIMSSAYGMEDLAKPRGTGTYFPNMSFRSYKERQSPRGRNSVLANRQPRSRNNGRGETSTDRNLSEESSQEPPSQAQVPIFSGNGRGKPAPLDVSQSPRTASRGGSHVNGSVYPPEGKLAFGSFGAVPIEVSSPERGSRVESFSTQGSGSVNPVSTEQRPQMGRNHDRPTQPYQLKDEVDFPPLAS